MQQNLRKVAVIGGVRTPFCRGNTGYDDLTNLDLMTAALNGLVEKYHLEGQHIDEVVGGAVVTHAKDFNLTREAVIGTKLSEDTPGITLSQACGTSLQAALGSAAKIAIGQIDVGHRHGLRHGFRSADRAEALICQAACEVQHGEDADRQGKLAQRLLSGRYCR